MNRPRWPWAALALLGAFFSATLVWKSVARADALTLYVGGYTRNPGDGLCALQFDPQTGLLSDARLAAPVDNPEWLALSPNGRVLYASGARDFKGGLSALAIESGGALREISRQTADDRPVSFAVDATGRWLVGAYYGPGTWAVWPLAPDGTIGERGPLIQHEGSGPNSGRQKSPHAHQAMIAPDNARVWIVDLGIDKAMIYDFDAASGAIKPSVPAYAAVAPGNGPRHLAFARRGQFAYVINELSSTVSVFQGARGRPGAIQTVSTLPADYDGKNTGAEVQVSPDGRFLYASNRGYDSIASFAIQSDGTLKLVGFAKTGKEPRHFTLDPSGKWLLAGEQQDRSISVFAVNQKTGELTFKSKFEGVLNQPTCLVFG